MHSALVLVLSALAAGFLLMLALYLERWQWRRAGRFRLAVPGRGGNVWDRALLIALAVVILSAFAMLVYTVVIPRVEDRFTEFYLLGLSGEAKDYPGRLMVGEEGKVTVSIINREQAAATYRVEVRIGGVVSNEVGPVTLEHGEKWGEVVGFTPDRAGDKQKVEFLLYRQGQIEAYRQLYLLVDVK